jgi:hypothetical protein
LLAAGADPAGALEIATKGNRREIIEILKKNSARP